MLLYRQEADRYGAPAEPRVRMLAVPSLLCGLEAIANSGSVWGAASTDVEHLGRAIASAYCPGTSSLSRAPTLEAALALYRTGARRHGAPADPRVHFLDGWHVPVANSLPTLPTGGNVPVANSLPTLPWEVVSPQIRHVM